jgi:flagellar protein FlbD
MGVAVIRLHRLRGGEVYLNPDLIESVEATPDSVITLVDGRKMLVAETPDQVGELVREHKAAILAAADEIRDPHVAELLAFPGGKGADEEEDNDSPPPASG